jgi:pimeloyl-ACP methyl ester carboxylesterase
VVKAAKSPTPASSVRTRRAYFDCAFGQLHVRTAFPTTGGFDEQVTLFCLHPIDSSSRIFGALLPALADVRSVYAPDLPGYGESDASPAASSTDAATAVSDLANGLRLRQIDLFGIQYGATVALELAAARPELVRRLVLSGTTAAEHPAGVKQQQCVVDAAEFGEHPSEEYVRDMARQIDRFLSARASSP